MIKFDLENFINLVKRFFNPYDLNIAINNNNLENYSLDLIFRFPIKYGHTNYNALNINFYWQYFNIPQPQYFMNILYCIIIIIEK